MSTLLLPELAQELAGSNGRVAESLEAESRWLEKLRGECQEVEALKKRAVRGARRATGATVNRKAEVLGVWQLALEDLEDGLAGEQSKEILLNVQTIIESWLRLARNSRAMWTFAAAIGSSPEGLEGLSAAETEVQQVKASLEQMQAFLTRARPPVDGALLEGGRQEIARGRYKTAEQIHSGRLGTGGA